MISIISDIYRKLILSKDTAIAYSRLPIARRYLLLLCRIYVTSFMSKMFKSPKILIWLSLMYQTARARVLRLVLFVLHYFLLRLTLIPAMKLSQREFTLNRKWCNHLGCPEMKEAVRLESVVGPKRIRDLLILILLSLLHPLLIKT